MKRWLNVFFMILIGVMLCLTAIDSMAQRGPSGPRERGDDRGGPPSGPREPGEDMRGPGPGGVPGPGGRGVPGPRRLGEDEGRGEDRGFGRGRFILNENGPVVLSAKIEPPFIRSSRSQFFFILPQEEAQTVTIEAKVKDPQGMDNIDWVRLFLIDPSRREGREVDTLLSLPLKERIDTQTGVFGLTARLQEGIPPGEFLFAIVSKDKDNHFSNRWPFFSIIRIEEERDLFEETTTTTAATTTTAPATTTTAGTTTTTAGTTTTTAGTTTTTAAGTTTTTAGTTTTTAAATTTTI